MHDRAAQKPLILPSKWMPLDTNHVPQTPGRLRPPPAPVALAHPSPDCGRDLALPRHHNNGSSDCDKDAPDPVLFELRVLRPSTDATAGSRWHDGGLLCLQQCLCGFCVSKNTHINTRTQVFFHQNTALKLRSAEFASTVCGFYVVAGQCLRIICFACR